jgi:hypothetical protein
MLLTFFATRVFEPEVLEAHEATARIQRAVDALAEVTEGRLTRLGVDTSQMNVAITSRAAIATILGVALFEDWLLPPRRRPTRQQIVRELTRQIMFGGFNQRPAQFRRLSTQPRAKVTTVRSASPRRPSPSHGVD